LIATEPPPGPAARAATWLRWVLAAGLLAMLAIAVMRKRRQGSFTRAATLTALALVVLTSGAFWIGTAGRMSEPRKERLVSELLNNVYRAFDFRDEERIYDVLEQSVSGDLLTDIYLETRRGLELRNQGGARVKVKELELVELETRSGTNGGFVARAVWNVAGSVGHWGHVHQRTNRYRASLGIEPVDGVWKLTSLELLEEERLEPGASEG